MNDLTGNQLTLDHTYEVGDVLHRGPLATLYSAKWTLFDVPVQIRSYESLIRLKLRHRDTSRLKSLVQNDAGRIRGPGLPDTIDMGQEDHTRPFLVYRLPEGRLLTDHLREEGRLSMEATARVIEEIANALDTCRAAGLPHRGPTADRVWITDDGHAILLGVGEVLYRLDTLTMSGVATTELVWHLPPEAFESDNREVRTEESLADERTRTGRLRLAQSVGDNTRDAEDDPRAEVYALSCLAYHCLAGHHPFFVDPNDPSEGIVATLRDTPLELRDIPPESEFSRAVFEGLSRNPEERPDSPQEVARSLNESLGLSTGEAASPRLRELPDEVDTDPEPSYERPAGQWLWKFSAVVLLLGVAGYTLMLRLQPTTLVITSEPTGVEMEEVVGHTAEPRGTTPLLLRDRPPHVPITLRVVAPDGTRGEPTTLYPAEFEDLGQCRGVSLELTYPDAPLDGASTGTDTPSDGSAEPVLVR